MLAISTWRWRGNPRRAEPSCRASVFGAHCDFETEIENVAYLKRRSSR